MSRTQTVQVKSSTWARDSHDLFDFEAQQLHLHDFKVDKSTNFFRESTEVQAVGDKEAVPSKGDPLLRLVQRESQFWVDRFPSHPSQPNSSKKLWLVVRELANQGHRLQEGDIMKLGRFKFRVRQLAAGGQSGQQQPELKLDESGIVCARGQDSEDVKSVLCRICLLEGPGEDDPLISPCNCKGSIEYVHLGCLRHWIRGRLNLSDSPSGSYFYRPLACELCKDIYPTYIQNNSEREPLVEVPVTKPPFILLENMVRDSQQHATKGLHVISLAEKVLKLGRGHESDVRIADVSISRYHATIRFQKGCFVLEDNKSKFGTLVAMKKPRLLEPANPISIQMGRTVLKLVAQQDGAQSQPLMPPSSATSTPQDERALRLSLLTRSSSLECGTIQETGAAGQFLEVNQGVVTLGQNSNEQCPE